MSRLPRCRELGLVRARPPGSLSWERPLASGGPPLGPYFYVCSSFPALHLPKSCILLHCTIHLFYVPNSLAHH